MSPHLQNQMAAVFQAEEAAVAAAGAAAQRLAAAELELAKVLSASVGGSEELAVLESGFRVSVILEHCTHKRPTATLGGTTAKYTDTAAEVRSALSRAECIGRAEFSFQSNQRWRVSPDPLTEPMLVAQETLNSMTRSRSRASSAGRPSSSPAQLRGMEHRLRGLADQAQVASAVLETAQTPQEKVDFKAGKWPRVGAFELAVIITFEHQCCGPFLLHSKVRTGKWPTLALLESRLQRCANSALALLAPRLAEPKMKALEARRAEAVEADAAAERATLAAEGVREAAAAAEAKARAVAEAKARAEAERKAKAAHAAASASRSENVFDCIE